MSLLALNAYEIYCLNENIMVECDSRDESLKNLANQNRTIDSCIKGMEYKINRLLESI